jgi:hypothetical protein
MNIIYKNLLNLFCCFLLVKKEKNIKKEKENKNNAKNNLKSKKQ